MAEAAYDMAAGANRSRIPIPPPMMSMRPEPADPFRLGATGTPPRAKWAARRACPLVHRLVRWPAFNVGQPAERRPGEQAVGVNPRCARPHRRTAGCARTSEIVSLKYDED